METLCRWLRTGIDEPFMLTRDGYKAVERGLEQCLRLPVYEASPQIETFLRMAVALDDELACPTLASQLWYLVKKNKKAVAMVQQGRSQERLEQSAEAFARRWGTNSGPRTAPRLGQAAPEGTMKASLLFDVGHQGSRKGPKVVSERLDSGEPRTPASAGPARRVRGFELDAPGREG